MVSYTYDSWGNAVSVTGSLASTVGQLNPFRYRGYYYDSESGLYYLGSRYYDSEICRMLNADDSDILDESHDDITDKNLFAYCDNNPIVRVDDDGDFWGAIVNISTVYVGDVFDNIFSGKKGLNIFKPKSSLADYATAGITGLIPGSKFISMAARSLISATASQANNNQGKFSIKDFAISTVKNIGAEMLGKGVTKTLSKLKVGKVGTKSYTKYKKKISKTLKKVTRKNTYKRIDFINRNLQYTINAINYGINVSTRWW